MTKLVDVLGSGDEDVLNFQAGVAGLAFSGFTDEQIAEFAIEEAQAYRKELNDELAKSGLKPAFSKPTK